MKREHALLEEAVQLDPNLAVAWIWRGTSRNRFGQPELAIADLERAMRLSPRDAFMFLAHGQIGSGALHRGSLRRGGPMGRSSVRLLKSSPNSVIASWLRHSHLQAEMRRHETLGLPTGNSTQIYGSRRSLNGSRS